MSPNMKKMWGCILGQPTDRHPNLKTAATLIVKWIGVYDGTNYGARATPELLFFTRRAAEDYARKQELANDCWTYHAKKYIPKR